MTPLERLAGYNPEVDFQRLKLANEKAYPFTIDASLKKKTRQMFGYFKNSIPKTQRGKNTMTVEKVDTLGNISQSLKKRGFTLRILT